MSVSAKGGGGSESREGRESVIKLHIVSVGFATMSHGLSTGIEMTSPRRTTLFGQTLVGHWARRQAQSRE